MRILESIEAEYERLRQFKDRDIAVATMPNSQLWMWAQDYRRMMGLGNTQFQHLKNLGKFRKGTHPATLYLKRIKIHAWFNYNQQEFIPPGYTDLTTQKKRGKYGKVKKDKGRSTRASKPATKQPQRRADDAVGQYMPGPSEQSQA